MSAKPICLYLPQFHPIPENDQWWGKGFTEWTNVAASQPKFEGHYQPHVPADMGFYDLRLESVLTEQAELARKYGVYGFCFYHYWFNGKLLLEHPIEQLLRSGKPDFPFCLCWANENWTRRWDGKDKEVLMEQHYNLEDDRAHIQYLIPFFKDERYIRIDGRPVFLMYRSELHPQPEEAARIWREEVKKAGIDDLYLIRVEGFDQSVIPADHGFDAGLEFAPTAGYHGKKAAKDNPVKYLGNKLLHTTGLKNSGLYENFIYSYPVLADNMMARPEPAYTRFRSVCPSWDNSARRKKNATIYIKSSPQKFGEWARFTKNYTEEHFKGDEQLFFINAWNEWAEGCHLEPDQKYKHQYLQALKNALD